MARKKQAPSKPANIGGGQHPMARAATKEFIRTGCLDIDDDDPFARDGMAAYIVAMEEDGDYPDLVPDAKQKFIDLFGEW